MPSPASASKSSRRATRCPTTAGERAARRILALARGLGPDDQLVFLASGGGSALLALPAPGLTLADKQAVTRALLRSGATIGEINTVRKHLSAIKGGRLAAAAAPARIVTLAISDVPGDDPAVIASGPTVPDATTFADARAVLAKYRIDEPAAVIGASRRGGDGDAEARRPDLRAHAVRADRQPAEDRCAAAAEAALRRNVTPIVLSDRIEGEAREVALVHAAIALQLRAGQFRVGDRVVSPPAVLLSGGETTVTVTGKGRGGRNAEFLLALAVALDGAAGHLGARLRHRRHRRNRRQCRSDPLSGQHRAGRRPRDRERRRRWPTMTATGSLPRSAISS